MPDSLRTVCRRPGTLTAGVFLITLFLLLALNGNRFVPTNDEGILLDPAQRMAAGAVPYRDFFGYMSPGSYWIQAGLFRVFGLHYWVGRLPVLFDFSLQCCLLFWLVQRLGPPAQKSPGKAAVAAWFVFLGFQIGDPAFLTAQHRWDSSALALAAICLLTGANRTSSTLRLFSAGILCAAAAWCTPSMLLVAAVVCVWLWFSGPKRKMIFPFLGGVAACTLTAAGWLAGHGALAAIIRQMLWLQANYARVNVMPYGSVIGGYGRLFSDSAGAEYTIRCVIVLCLMLPAILPVLAFTLWGAALVRKVIPGEQRSVIFLLLPVALAFTLTAFPRADLMHLAFVAVLAYALTAAALARLLSVRAGAILAFTMIPLAALFAVNDISGRWQAQSVPSPVGTLSVAKETAPQLRSLFANVRQGDSLFVHPYMPVLYFLTQAKNPTSFSFLAPGMMTHTEELQALGELQAHPPQWTLYLKLTSEEFARVFPTAKGSDGHFPALETWIEQNYIPVDGPAAVNLGGYRLWRRKDLGVPGLQVSQTRP